MGRLHPLSHRRSGNVLYGHKPRRGLYEWINKITNKVIVNDYLNGVSIEGIYDSLPIFYKNRDRFDKTKIYEITCKSADVNTTTDLSIGLVVLEKDGVLDISILNSLRTNIEDAIKEKYTQLMNKELNKIGKQVNAITTKKL